MKRIKIVLLCLAPVFLYLSSRGQVIEISDLPQSFAVGYPSYLTDPEAAYTFENIRQGKMKFVQAKDQVPDFLGNMAKAVWYRFEVVNKSNQPNWYLEIKGGFMHKVTVYSITADSVVQSLSLNADNNFDARPVKSNNLLFGIHIPPGSQQHIYVRATSKTLIRTSMSLSTMQTLYEKSVFTSYADGFFTAIVIAMLLYNLFVYLTLKESVYLYYIGYMLTAILHTNLVSGHAQIFAPCTDGINSTTILPLVSLFSILFTNSFLRTKIYAPFIYRTRWAMMIICLVPWLYYVTGAYGMGILTVAILVFILFTYWITAGILVFLKGFRPAGFYLTGFGALAAMSVVFEMKMKGLLPENYWTDSSLLIGAAAEAVVLSLALASKINFYKKEKELIQQKAHEQSISFAGTLIQMQEAERKRIASELHDSLGQKLILIKNKILKNTVQKAGVSHDDTLTENVAEAIQEIRTIAYGLRPYQIDLLGLTSSVSSLAEESFDAADISFDTNLDDIDGIFDNNDSINVYRIIQECVNNIIKHSGATHADITIKRSAATVAILIRDNGSGFDSRDNYPGFGLKGIKERLQLLNGSMVIYSRKPLGTLFEFHIPLPHTLL